MKNFDLVSFESLQAFFTSQEFLYLSVLGGVCVAVFIFTRTIITPLLVKAFGRKDAKWQKILVKEHTFRQVAYLVPVLALTYGLSYLPSLAESVTPFLDAYVVINLTLLMGAFIRTGVKIYELSPLSKERPIKSYSQLAILILYIFGAILAICKITGTNPAAFLTGAVAVMAAVLLVFRDTILSFIASMQIAANGLIKKGDWIEVKNFGADGDVIDIALHVIRVQNFDKTIVSIPTYKLMETGFKNWRGMFESGGRQIKRSLLLDQKSINFVSDADLDKLFQNYHVQKYLPTLDELKQEHHIDHRASLTNLGVFRTYVENYLKSNQNIHQEMTLIVRHLEPTPDGIPLQLYAYTTDTRWGQYESIQADIFEHIIALLPVFKLRLFQNRMDTDLEALDHLYGAVDAQKRVRLG